MLPTTQSASPGSAAGNSSVRSLQAASAESKGSSPALSVPVAGGDEAELLRPGLSLRELEKRLLEITLRATAGNRTHAAAMLGVSLRTVRNKIREHGLPPRGAV
jgi:DNA-binding NtrC family response regulator